MAHLPSVIYEVTVKPAARLDWGFLWNSRGWLDESPGDTIGDGAGGSTAPVWTFIDEADSATDLLATKTSVWPVVDDDTARLVFSLVSGHNYILTCRVKLHPSGREDERSLRLRCRR